MNDHRFISLILTFFIQQQSKITTKAKVLNLRVALLEKYVVIIQAIETHLDFKIQNIWRGYTQSYLCAA